MGGRSNKSKRKREPVNKPESEDEGYGESTKRPRRARASRAQATKMPKSRRSRQVADDSEEVESDEINTEEESLDEVAEAKELEFHERTGRPKRKSTMQTKYEEPDDEDEDLDVYRKSEPAPRKRRTQVVKLKVQSAWLDSGSTARNTRSGSRPQSKRAYSAEPLSAGTRRSTRLHHNEDEAMVALTNSGHHVEVVREATRSPDTASGRRTRGGKGYKAPTTSAIFEEGEETRLSQTDNPEEHGEAQPKEGQDQGTAIEEHMPSVEDSDPDAVGDPLQTDSQKPAEADLETEEIPAVEENVDEPEEAEIIYEMAGGKKGGEDDNDDEDEAPVVRRRRSTARKTSQVAETQGPRRSQRNAGRQQETSDFELGEDESGDEDISSDDSSQVSPRKNSQKRSEEAEGSGPQTRSRRLTRARSGTASRRVELDTDEEDYEGIGLQRELRDLNKLNRESFGTAFPRPRRSDIAYVKAPNLRNRRKEVDYRDLRPDQLINEDPDSDVAPAVRPNRKGAAKFLWRSLVSTRGPFGGAEGLGSHGGGPEGLGAAGGVDSDSSDDERELPQGAAHGLLAQAHGADPLHGAPANLGKIKDKKALADIDPLGVPQDINFDSVGGLQDHINQLKEMVLIPLLYPELFQQFQVTPPRGVLFHGPPGTGKTLMARALAASVSSEGRKITFYMRKGADALSKWVGEAERNLRLLFEEAKANQPSIIFFDEIDGLAPVRSSKQEQIHASIVSTLLALMDGMDGRGQVIVIGATNRPDSVDPALRRPGRFDREFYFPLPGKDARRTIIDIHTKNWQPGLSPAFKDQLADMTKGYGGADLRGLCTEAALNAIQRRYPQIYTSKVKLKIDPSSVHIGARDFKMAMQKLVPSSQRSTATVSAPLPAPIEPLLRQTFQRIKTILSEILPQEKKLTALEEAEYEFPQDTDDGFQREQIQQDFEISRVFRPRLLIRGLQGMGQEYIARAILDHFEGVHVQSFDLATLMSDSPSLSPESVIVRLFSEARQRMPSVIFIPNLNAWYRTLDKSAISTFLSLLRTLAPTDPVLVLGVLEDDGQEVNKRIVKTLFGYSAKNQFELTRPDEPARKAYFGSVVGYIRKAPDDFPDPRLRKRRKIEHLEEAPPPPPPPPPTKEERQAQAKRDRHLLNLLKIRILPVMEQINKKYKRFVRGVIEDEKIEYLYDERDPRLVTSDAPPAAGSRPFEIMHDKDGVQGLLEVDTNKFYYNLNTIIIEERLANGYYKRPKDFLADIKTLVKDARTSGDRERLTKAQEMLSNVEVDMTALESDPQLADCENVYRREMERLKAWEEKRAQAVPPEETDAQIMSATGEQPLEIASHAATFGSLSSHATSAALQLQAGMSGAVVQAQVTPTRPSDHGSLSNGFSSGPSYPKSQGHMSNGSVAPSKSDPDSQPPGANDRFSAYQQSHHGEFQRAETPRPSQASQLYHGLTATQRERSGLSYPSGANTQHSQRSVLTAMPAGSQVEDFVNSASTTTSGKKTSDSNRSSDPWHLQMTHSATTSGRKDIPDFSTVESKANGDSQLPDTQGKSTPSNGSSFSLTHDAEVPSSQGSGHQSSSQSGSSQPPVPAFNVLSRPSQVPSVQALLNNTPSQPEPQPEFIMDEAFINGLHEKLTERTSGCSVEQLEQVHAALMASLWQQRAEWNRTKVGTEVMQVFNDVMEDIEQMQNVLPASVETPEDELMED